MSEQGIPEIKDHFPYVTRSLLRLFGQKALTNVASIDVEPDYGYVARLTYVNGGHRVTYGNDLGLNTGSAADLARDKGHTKFMLRSIGVNCPDGQEFLLPWWADTIRRTQESRGNTDLRTADMAQEYVDATTGFPVYVKPVNGSKGGDIFKAHTPEELQDALATYEEKKLRVAMVEEPIMMPDYRIVTLDGELISAYKRVPLTVTGDGVRTVRQLLEVRQNEFDALGRDTNLVKVQGQVEKYLMQHSLSLDTVVDEHAILQLVPISNLSTGGTSVDVSDEIHDRWTSLAAYVADNLDLRLAGLDLACTDITAGDSDYSVLEVNAAPGLDHYASSGEAQRKIVDELYVKVLNKPPKTVDRATDNA